MTWERVKLRDLGTWYGGGTPSKSNSAFWVNGDVPWLSPKDMGPEVLSATQDHVTEAAVAGSSTKLVPARSVAVVTRSGILNRTIPIALVPFATTMNQDMKAVVPREDIDVRWIAWGLRAFEHELLRVTRKTGTTVASIEMPRWYDFELPVPPLEEQRRIVTILEDHLSRLDVADSTLSATKRKLAHYESSGVAQLFADAGQWPQLTAHQLVGEDRTRLVIGPFGSNLKTSDYRPEGIPLVFVRDIRANEFDSPRVFVDENKAAELASHMVVPGDVLVTKMGEPPGDATVYAGDGPAIITADCIRLRPLPGIESKYIALAFGAPRVRSQIEKITSGVAQQKVSLGRFRKGVSIPVPSHDAQLRVIEHSRELFDVTHRLRTEISDARIRSTALRRSLLAAAFSGRLTGSSTEMSAVREKIDA